MAKIAPVTNDELKAMLPAKLFFLWQTVTERIEAAYDMDKEWDTGGKMSKHCMRYRRGGKTLVTLLPKENTIGLMVVYGKDERAKFESRQAEFSGSVIKQYNEATTYHDGKWIMYDLPDNDVLNDLPLLLAIKRKPNRK